MTGFSSFNNSTSERVLSLLEASNVRLRELVQFGVDDGGGNGTSCCGIEVRTDKHATKLSNMVIATFGEGRNLVRKGKVFVEDKSKSKIATRVDGVQ